jgi:O-antigen/teichoic acid export membrane protein
VLATAGVAAGLLVPDSDAGHLMRIYAIGGFIGSLDSASGPVLRVLDRFGLAFATSSTAILARLGLVIVVVALGGGLEALVWARVGGEVLLTLLQGSASMALLYPLLRHERASPISALRGRAREIRSFLIATNLAGVVRIASSKLDTVLVGLLASPSTVGLYRLAVQFGKAPLLLGDALNLAVYPAFARDVARGNTDHIRSVARRASTLLAFLLVPLVIVAAFVADSFIAAVAGEAFRDAGTAFLLCIAGVVPYVICFWLYPVMLSTGHAGAFLRAATIGTAVQLVAIVALVPPFGAAGAAAGLGLNYLVATALMLSFLHRRRVIGGAERSTPEAYSGDKAAQPVR